MSTSSPLDTISATAVTATLPTSIVTAGHQIFTVITTDVVVIPSPTGTDIPIPETVATTLGVTDYKVYTSFKSAAASSSTLISTTSTPTRTPTASLPSSSPVATSSDALSTGSLVGIVVGCLPGLNLFLLIYIWNRKVEKKERARLSSVMSGSENQYTEFKRLHKTNRPYLPKRPHASENSNGKVQLPAFSAKRPGVFPKMELSTDSNWHELDARQQQHWSISNRAELEGSDVKAAERNSDEFKKETGASDYIQTLNT